ncbi:uroporphyrinogen-III synthase [Tsuneonella mangrovi]|uniref:uroporphyrinogen-III synthase n=1 Tax=Tsuneonella mangrovi TaxID=1982042 RepID=UPI000BA27A15|nr:uroporphyrinogen-III synthase [Tsuneonella mangrovi]
MSRKVVVLRPEPGLSETLSAARTAGLEAIGSPLFEIEPVAWDLPDPAEFDALLVGSANVFRHGGQGLEQLRALPVHAVGKRTAQAAHDAGFEVSSVGSGGLQQVLDGLSAPLRLLRLAGAERVTLTPPAGITTSEKVVYRAAPLPLEDNAVEILSSGDAVALLHSGAAARRLAAECERVGLARGSIALAALAPRIAECAGEGWKSVQVAPQTDDAALLAMLADICH